MKKRTEQISQLVDLANSLNGRRYPAGIVCYADPAYLLRVVPAAAKEVEARYVDLASDLLPHTAEPGFFPTLGAYGPDDLATWLTKEARNPETASLIVGQIEPLLATFGRGQVVWFFQSLAQMELRKPVCLVTYLKNQVSEANFPDERLLIV